MAAFRGGRSCSLDGSENGNNSMSIWFLDRQELAMDNVSYMRLIEVEYPPSNTCGCRCGVYYPPLASCDFSKTTTDFHE